MLLSRNVVVAWMLNGYRVASITFEPARFSVSIGIDFDKIATSHLWLFDIEGRHLGNGNTIPVNRYLVAKLVATLILAIHDDINRLSPWCIRRTDTFAHLECKAVTHQSLVAIVIDERPLLSLCWTFHRGTFQHVVTLAIIELDAPRFLREAP